MQDFTIWVFSADDITGDFLDASFLYIYTEDLPVLSQSSGTFMFRLDVRIVVQRKKVRFCVAFISLLQCCWVSVFCTSCILSGASSSV